MTKKLRVFPCLSAAYRALPKVPYVFGSAFVAMAVADQAMGLNVAFWLLFLPACLAFQVVGVAAANTVQAGGRWTYREASRKGVLLFVPACVVMGMGIAVYALSDSLFSVPAGLLYFVLGAVPIAQSLVVVVAGIALLAAQLVLSGILVVVFWIAVPVCVVEGSDPFVSVGRSFALTRGNFARLGTLFSLTAYLPCLVMVAAAAGHVYADMNVLSVFGVLANVIFVLASSWLVVATPVVSTFAYRSLADFGERRSKAGVEGGPRGDSAVGRRSVARTSADRRKSPGSRAP